MTHEELIDLGERVLKLAQSKGADSADVVASQGTEFEVTVADGKIITLTQAKSKGMGLRVFVGGRLGFCVMSDFTPNSVEHTVERAVAMAREAADDPNNGLPDELEAGRIEIDDAMELYDPRISELPAETKISWAHEMEQAAREVDPRIKKFSDSGVTSGESESILMTSTGAIRCTRGSGMSLWCSPIAEQNGELQTEVWYDSKTHLEDLESATSVGTRAGERALRMLGAHPVPTQEVPVIFEPHMAAGFVGGFLGAIDGDMIYKGASFLAGKLGEQIGTEQLTVIDDPHLKRGLGSTPFDGEGLPTTKKTLIDHGRLTTFLYDAYTARKAGTKPTANAHRSYGSLPSVGTFNFCVQAGQVDEADIKKCERALLVTRGLGRGINVVSGEYSRGANGLWIENGQVVHPVQEVTIAGDFVQLLQAIDAVGNKVHTRGSSSAPWIRIGKMTISGTRSN